MKARMTKKIVKYHYDKESDARKETYGWDNTETTETEDVLIDCDSIRSKFEEVLRMADESGYEMYRFDLYFRKTPNKSLRKEVRFYVKEDKY